MDTIFLEDLRVETVIGIYDWEREIRQTVSLDLEMSADIRRAAASDRVTDTVDYKQVAKRLIGYVGASRFELIETLVERAAEIVMYEFGVSRVKVRLGKPGAVRYSRTVGIEIVRERLDIPWRTVYISIGSNVEPERHIRSALGKLDNEFGPLRRSTVYRNPAVGFEGNDFLNLVAGFESALPLEALIHRLNWIEAAHGRQREGPKFAPRTLDLDLLLCGDTVLEHGGLKLPRGDITRYAFVLGPLAELDPDRVHPVLGKSIGELWAQFPDGGKHLQSVDLNPGPEG